MTSATDKMQALLARCKCGVYLTVNEHRDVYETAEEAIDQMMARESPPYIEPEVRARMIETNTIIELQAYPDTPVGFNLIVHHDLDAALDMMLEACSQ